MNFAWRKIYVLFPSALWKVTLTLTLFFWTQNRSDWCYLISITNQITHQTQLDTIEISPMSLFLWLVFSMANHFPQCRIFLFLFMKTSVDSMMPNSKPGYFCSFFGWANNNVTNMRIYLCISNCSRWPDVPQFTDVHLSPSCSSHLHVHNGKRKQVLTATYQSIHTSIAVWLVRLPFQWLGKGNHICLI